MRKTDNKGFSLIELLIAIVILGIVVVPLMNGFLYSYRVNSRSRQVLEATTLAQNEMEIFESKTVEQLRGFNVYHANTNATGYQLSEDVDKGILQFQRQGVTNGTAEYAFDVYVKLDAAKENATDRYSQQNAAQLLAMNTIGMADTAVYVQDVKVLTDPANHMQYINYVGGDEEAYAWFFNNKLPTSVVTTIEGIEAIVERKITLDVEKYAKVGETDPKYTRVKVKYEYFLNNAHVVSSAYSHFTGIETVIYDNAQQLDGTGNPIELSSVYLFFAPKYKFASLDKDEIYVNNKQGLPIDIYVVRQELLADNATENNQIKPVPTGYQPRLVISDRLGAGGTRTKATYYTNLNISGSLVGSENTVELTLKDESVSFVSSDRVDILNLTGLRPLTATESKDRIYEMTVSVYKKGETTDPLVVLTGTKLE